jgi:hypothetical protein
MNPGFARSTRASGKGASRFGVPEGVRRNPLVAARHAKRVFVLLELILVAHEPKAQDARPDVCRHKQVDYAV